MHQEKQNDQSKGGLARRVLVTIAGVTLCAVGIGLLVLPGPGLLLVLGGLVLLANEYPWARRIAGPVRRRAMQAAAQSVASPLRAAVTALCGLALIGAGIACILVPSLPLGGAATGSSLILSGIVLLALLAYSYRFFHQCGGNGPVTRCSSRTAGTHIRPQ